MRAFLLIKFVILVGCAPSTIFPAPEGEGTRTTSSPGGFADIQGQWAQQPVEALVQHGWIKGFSDGCFRPSEPIRRAHWAQVVAQALALPLLPCLPGQLVDVSSSHPQQAAICALARAGLVTGDAQHRFHPEQAISVAELVAITARAFGWATAQTPLAASFVQGSRLDGHWAAPDIRTLVGRGVLALEANPQNLEPDRPATRAEAVATLYLALRQVKNLPPPPIQPALARHIVDSAPLTPTRRWNSEQGLTDSATFVNQFWALHGQTGSFSGAASWPIAYAKAEHLAEVERGALVILPGYSESYVKHAEVAYDFYGQGYSVYSLDHRGQAGSGRFLDDWNKAYIDDFERFVDDLKILMDQQIKRQGRRIYAYAHSQGGAILTRYLERYPDDFTAVVLSSPMHQMKLPAPEQVVWAMVKLGKPTDYAMGKGPYKREEFADCTTTNSELRFNRARGILDDNPELRIGGQTNQWVREALEANWRMGDEAASLVTPLLLLQADQDTYVSPGRQGKICKAAASCTLVHIAGSRHELYNEVDAIRQQALEQARQFLAQH